MCTGDAGVAQSAEVYLTYSAIEKFNHCHPHYLSFRWPRSVLSWSSNDCALAVACSVWCCNGCHFVLKSSCRAVQGIPIIKQAKKKKKKEKEKGATTNSCRVATCEITVVNKTYTQQGEASRDNWIVSPLPWTSQFHRLVSDAQSWVEQFGEDDQPHQTSTELARCP